MFLTQILPDSSEIGHHKDMAPAHDDDADSELDFLTLVITLNENTSNKLARESPSVLKYSRHYSGNMRTASGRKVHSKATTKLCIPHNSVYCFPGGLMQLSSDGRQVKVQDSH